MIDQYDYEICIEGILPDLWSDWFDDMSISNGPDCVTTLKGIIIRSGSVNWNPH